MKCVRRLQPAVAPDGAAVVVVLSFSIKEILPFDEVAK
ncbi:hypothetical protein PAMC26510_08765 [Caballeronia sordidicola]|uniref:Uncharacterized protein n=1 Tax=Caballeronia sordidicola TaxID=196367 RepID=A0A242N2G1_CABSO|nr:hypothetical protein PAMC26510_08765 [Caballeronia sordidicola]